MRGCLDDLLISLDEGSVLGCLQLFDPSVIPLLKLNQFLVLSIEQLQLGSFMLFHLVLEVDVICGGLMQGSLQLWRNDDFKNLNILKEDSKYVELLIQI